MDYKFEFLNSDVLSSMKEIFSLAAGYEVNIADEIEYFNEVSPKGWIVAKNFNSEIVGFIRHFPQNDWAPIELYVDTTLANRSDLSEQLIKTFLTNNTFPKGFRIRFNISALDIDLNQTIQKLKLSEKAETFLYFEMNLFGETDQRALPDLPNKGDSSQMQEALCHLHQVTEDEVKIWLDNNALRAIYKDGKPVAVAHISIGNNSAEIIRIATHQNHLRQGFGTSLLKNIKSELFNKNIKNLYLKVDECRSPAIELYKSLGFREKKDLKETWYSKWF